MDDRALDLIEATQVQRPQTAGPAYQPADPTAGLEWSPDVGIMLQTLEAPVGSAGWGRGGEGKGQWVEDSLSQWGSRITFKAEH